MDYNYKYIEQLLEAYWNCQTSIEEERILRAFFQQKMLPDQLAPYRHLFCYETTQQEENCLGKTFDERIMKKVTSPQKVKAQRISLWESLRPLCRAAAVVAVILTLGGAIEHAFDQWQDSSDLRHPDQPLSRVPTIQCDSNSTNRQTATIKIGTDSIVPDADKKKDFALKH